MNIKDDFILAQINEGYLVGGTVRDALMGKISYDRDIAIRNAETFAQKIAKKFDGTLITLDEENHIYRIVLPDKLNYLDISEIQGNSIEQDLLRRDFTINAIAYDLKNNDFIDVTGGINDLKSAVLRHIKDENFADDPLRLLRAFRFAAVTGFEMTPELKAAIKKYTHLALNPAPERINYELMKLLGGENAAKILLLMDEFGLLEKIFPCVNEMKRVVPNSHHHLDLFHHVVETVNKIEIAYAECDTEIKEHLDALDFGGFPRINHLKLAGFLHDIGKFSTWTIEGGKCNGSKCEGGKSQGGKHQENCLENCQVCSQDSRYCGMRHRFIKHDDVGSKMVVPLLKKWKFSKKQIEYISCMIKNHIYPSSVLAAPDLNEKVMMRYIRKMDDNVIDNIILARADRLSAKGIDVTEEMIQNNLDGLDKLLKFYLEKRKTLEPLPKLIDGTEIMNLLNIKPSAQLGQIIKALEEAQISGDVVSKTDAEIFVKKFYEEQKY